MIKRVAVALSGGVDSSVAAFLLKEQGYDVVGVCAKTACTPDAALVVSNAEKVAKKLEIPFFALDVADLFQTRIIDYFVRSYQNGETPNPCIMCNKYIKWGFLYDYAIKNLNADFIATGHYARIDKADDFYRFYPASDEHKDQLYFLFLLGQEQLSKTLFPLSNYRKEDVRKIANDNDLPSKSSKESQDICFIKYPMTTKKFLNNLFESKKGNFVEKSTGKVLGYHDGFWQYTVGQRKGIGLAAPEALYVTNIDSATNTVVVGYKNELYEEKLVLKDFNWSYPIQSEPFEALVKIRYNMQAVNAKVEILQNRDVVLKFAPNTVSAIAKGQACVLYDKNDGHLIGGAFI